MPIYEYQCQACEQAVEVLQKLNDAPLRDCPACGEPTLKKKVSAAAFRLKGSGWYETDFKTGNKRNLAGNADAGSGSVGGSDKPTGGGSVEKPGSSGGSEKSGTAKTGESTKTA